LSASEPRSISPASLTVKARRSTIQLRILSARHAKVPIVSRSDATVSQTARLFVHSAPADQEVLTPLNYRMSADFVPLVRKLSVASSFGRHTAEQMPPVWIFLRRIGCPGTGLVCVT
jgi:hypothetical protein